MHFERISCGMTVDSAEMRAACVGGWTLNGAFPVIHLNLFVYLCIFEHTAKTSLLWLVIHWQHANVFPRLVFVDILFFICSVLS